MKGIILAGGTGSRLYPLTKTINKHILPVYNKPMIYYPIQSMVDSGVNEILIVTGGNNAGDFLQVIGNGSQFGLKHIHYTYQEKPSGVADALTLAKDFAGDDNICVMLGDNILEKSFKKEIAEFEHGAAIFITQTERPEFYGVVILEDFKVKKIIEKPEVPESSWIQIGLYFYDKTVWDHLQKLSPSARNELEITDLNNIFVDLNQMKAHLVSGWWADAGENHDTYLDSGIKAREFFHA